jgi:hypothetical protein
LHQVWISDLGFSIPLTGGYAAKGNMLTSVDSVMGQWNYSYDNLKRLPLASAPICMPV